VAFGIASSTAANQTLLNQGAHQTSLLNSFNQLSSGLAIQSAADNPSGAAIAAFLQAGVNGTDQGTQNDIEGEDALNVAQGATQSIEGGLQQLNTLGVEASNDFLSPSEQNDVQIEATQITQQINTVGNQTQFNGVNLLQGANLNIQSGADEGATVNVQTPGITASSLGVSGLDFTNTAGAENAIGAAQSAINTLGNQQAQLGAQQVSINEDIDNNNILSTNLQASESNIADTDVGQAVTSANSSGILSQIATSVLAQMQGENSLLSGIFANHLA
jgi:flagellin